jgi:hypothetical protein
VCGNEKQQRLFLVQGVNKKELFVSEEKEHPEIYEGERSEKINRLSFYPRYQYSIGYFENKILIPDLYRNIFAF